jgi:hypothetical protein
MSLIAKIQVNGQDFSLNETKLSENLEESIKALKQAQNSADEFLTKLILNGKNL